MELSAFSNEVLEHRLKRLVRRESCNTVQILKHLAEVERRELHLRNGYASLWDYATRGLKYSEPGAHRRISSARALARYPQLEALLIERRINLSTLSLVAKLLSPGNLDSVMAEVIDRTKEQVEEFVKGQRPVARVIEKVTPVIVLKSPERTVTSSREPVSLSVGVSAGPVSKSVVPPLPESSPQPSVVQTFKIQCALSDEGYRKLKEVQSLLSHNATSIGDVVERLCDDFLRKHSPVREVKRTCSFPKEGSRYIPRALKKAVWERDGGCCSYVGPDGTRCGSTFQVQVDHVHPFALGGKTELGNVRCLCSSHNAFAAREVFGRPFMDQMIARGRRKAEA